ncbi:ROK family protein [Pontibacterium sp.]|uniref:ROK family protein n=1 Tax=Pontibacterium sp. TaxID=2036026 RepID=UPI0035640FB8
MRIGIDLGGTKIEAVALDQHGDRVYQERIATPQGNYHATLDQIVSLVSEIDQTFGIRAPVGVGIPGTISPSTGLVKNANSTCLIGRPLDKDLSARLQRPVRCANDANCFALSEASDGAAAGASSVFGVILGTGVGGGLVINQQIICGPNSISGEWGHNPLPWPSSSEAAISPCYCGRQGCIETWLSGPALSLQYQKLSGETLRSEEIWQRVSTGDPLAQALSQQYYRRLAKSLATVINMIDPEIIVLGGGLSNESSLYEAVPALWQQYVFSDTVVTRLVPAKFGDASGVRGAAWLWPEQH